jgi:hypothetical protein
MSGSGQEIFGENQRKTARRIGMVESVTAYFICPLSLSATYILAYYN